MSAALLKLERFDQPALVAGPAEHDIKTQQARAEAYAEGYAAGVAAASSKAGEREKLMASVAALIDEQTLNAPAKVREQAIAAVQAVFEAVFPALSRAGFAVEAAAALSAVAKRATNVSLDIATSAEHADALQALICDLSPNAMISVTADPEISGAAARAEWSGGGVEFDLDRAASDCLAALESAIGKTSNGKSS